MSFARRLAMRLLLLPLLLSVTTAAAPTTVPVPAFDSVAAWNEFEGLVRSRYGYLQRPGVDGHSILAHFGPIAKASTSATAFIDVLQLVAHNFADPHFIVGPLNNDDYAIYPTSADLFGQREGDIFRIIDVRRDSDAAMHGVPRGSRIISIDGLAPGAAIKTAMSRPLKELSAFQVNGGLNIALAGRRHHRRALVVATASGERKFDLAPTNDFADKVAERPPLTIERRGKAAIIRVENSLGDNATIKAFASAILRVRDSNRLVIDLRNTPSGGNTTVARAILGHFVDRERAYQIHVVPGEEREFGVPRKFVEYVLPIAPRYRGKVVVIGGHWTGSMGEGLMIAFRAIGIPTAGSRLAHLLGALSNEQLELSGARVDLGEEQLFDTRGRPREDFVPDQYDASEEADGDDDRVLDRALRLLR